MDELKDKPVYARPCFSGDDYNCVSQVGLTLLEYYAGLAMQAIISNGSYPQVPAADAAKGAVRYAFAMIKELEGITDNYDVKGFPKDYLKD